MKKLNRKSIRLKEYDYSQKGAYFVTICVQNRECLFGDIIDGKMVLNKYGEIAKNEWLKTAEISENIHLDTFVVMPNHIHGIVVIINGRGTARRAPTYEQFGKPTICSIPTIIRSFKSARTNGINKYRKIPGTTVWQRNYYEHIIRGEKDYNRIYEYIQNNPLKWELDSLHPMNEEKNDG